MGSAMRTAPYSPTTTGKVERLHKTLREEFFSEHTVETITEAQTGQIGGCPSARDPQACRNGFDDLAQVALADSVLARTSDDSAEAIPHVSHIIELLEPGNHRETMQTILNGLEQGGDTHGQEHDIEEMLAGSGSPDLTLTQLHLRQALISLAAGDFEESKHHVIHAQEHAGGELADSLDSVLQSLESNDLHALEHGLQELLGQEEDHD